MTDREILLEAADKRAGEIQWFYKEFPGKKPVMLLELPEDKILAYPYQEFKKVLSERSQKMLEQEYQEAIANNQMVVFVKDNDRKKMISFSVDEPE